MLASKQGQIELLDRIRRLNVDKPWRLYLHVTPADGWLIHLSEAGVLKMLGLPQGNCVDEMCSENGAPATTDCRRVDCPYAAIMRMRLIFRLRAAYARERNKLVGRS